MATIGFVGLGHMGNPMVCNLLKHQHQVNIYDINADAVNALLSHGAQAAKHLWEIADNDVMITMLQSGEQVQAVCSGENGLLAKAKPDTLFIDCSSIDIATTHQLHEEARSFKIAMVDAPVSGGVAGAQAGSLTFMVGGSEKNFERAKPILEDMGRKVIYAGNDGAGGAAKICNNMILGISMIAVSEAFNLAEKLGLEAKKLFEISSNASGQCWSLTQYAPLPGLVASSPANNDYKPGFAAKMMLKDLLLSQNAAQSAMVSTPLAAEATELYSLFVNQGNAELDFSAIIKFLKGEKD